MFLAKRIRLSLSLVALLASCAWAKPGDQGEQVKVIGPFGGLNTNLSAPAIGSDQAQDALNVVVTIGKKSVKKREGLALDATLFSSSPVHGMYHFYDGTGNDVRLVGSDNFLWASVNNATYVKVATGTYNATWQCTDNLGFAYCVTSSRDTPVKTDGTTTNTTYLGTLPLGTMITSTPERLLVAGTVANPSRLYYSGASNFTDFTVGALPSSSSYEDIFAPGSRLTHLGYYFGRWMWWKDQSFGYIVGTDQTNLQIKTVSNTIGTLDNSDAQDGTGYGNQTINAGVHFRGSDNQFYFYDGSNMIRTSVDIAPLVQSANRRKSVSWTQTSQSDFQGGTIVPTNNLSTTISAGDVTVSSFMANEFSSTQWNSGTSSNFAVGTSSLSLKVVDGNIPNNGFETGSISNWTSDFSASGNTTGVFCTLTPRSGSKALNVGTASCNDANYNVYLQALTCGGAFISSATIAQANNSCTYTARTLTIGSSYIGKSIKLKVLIDSSCSAQTAVSDCFVYSGTNPTFYTASDRTRTALPELQAMYFDDITSGSDTISTGYYTSPIYDTHLTSSTMQLQADWTVSSSTPTFSLIISTSNPSNNWTTLRTSTGTNAIANRYVFYTTTITVLNGQDANTYISSFTMLSRSTGTYYSAVHNDPLITGWGTLAITDSIVGGSTITYYTRSSNSSFAQTAAAPTWVAQAPNATVTTSSNTYYQMRADFTITAATENPTMREFTFNSYQGTASDKMYATYFDNAMWFSLSTGTATSNNMVARLDLINNLWTPFSIPANGFLIQNNSLYIGDSTLGKVYKYGGVYSDNGTAINSYWKSKDFASDDPFSQDEFKTLSLFAQQVSTGSLSVTYTVDQSSSSSFTVNLSSTSTTEYNKNLTASRMGSIMSLQFGDNSSNPPWEVYGAQYSYSSRPWKASYP